MARYKGLLTWVHRLLARPAAPRLPAPIAPVELPFIVAVVTFAGPENVAGGDKVAAILQGRDGIAITRATAASDETKGDTRPTSIIRLRHLLVESQADVAIWVEATGPHVGLRWITPALSDDDRPGALGPNVLLETSSDLQPLADLVYAVTLAAIQPSDEDRRRLHRRLLVAAVTAASGIGEAPPAFASPLQQASMQLCYAHAATNAALVGDDQVAGLERAVAAYHAGIERLRPDDLPPIEEATAHRRLATALTALAELKDDDAGCLQDAVAACRAAAEILPRGLMPSEWAAEQNRLGMALYRLDLHTGDDNLLREAIGAFQSALQVFTRTDAPARWAEVMHNLAQALEVYGDQSRSLEILRKAVAACRAVLEVRTRESDRAGWAATLNTLGFALFLLDKHGGTGGDLDEAAELLRTAAATFRELGAAPSAEVAERNLAHVERLNRQRRDHPGVDPGWVEAAEPAADDK